MYQVLSSIKNAFHEFGAISRHQMGQTDRYRGTKFMKIIINNIVIFVFFGVLVFFTN